MGKRNSFWGAPVSVNKARSHLANEIKKNRRAGRPLGAGSVQDARRALAEEKIKAYVERTVASAPSLSQAAKDRLTVLVGGQ